MKRIPTLSVILVTKNRSRLLKRALASLVGQCRKGDEIIVVDASDDDTPHVVTSFKNALPIRYVRFLSPGYPLFYNEGARVARNEILVFYDDDCVASKTYLQRIRQAHMRHNDAIIQGMTHSIPKGNLYVDIMADHYRNWLLAMTIEGNKLRTYDSKNASMRRRTFWKYGGLSPTMLKGSEDIEFGIRLRKFGVPIYLDRSIVASHHERTTLTAFLKQHVRFAQSEGSLDARLSKTDRLGIIPSKKLRLHLTSFLKREIRYIRQGRILTAFFVFVLYITLACIRVWGYATNR